MTLNLIIISFYFVFGIISSCWAVNIYKDCFNSSSEFLSSINFFYWVSNQSFLVLYLLIFFFYICLGPQFLWKFILWKWHLKMSFGLWQSPYMGNFRVTSVWVHESLDTRFDIYVLSFLFHLSIENVALLPASKRGYITLAFTRGLCIT